MDRLYFQNDGTTDDKIADDVGNPLRELWEWSRSLRSLTLDARIASVEARAHANDLRLRSQFDRR